MVAGEGAGDELRRRLGLGLRRIGEPEGERERGEVQEDRELTLSSKGWSVEAEEDGRRRNRRGGAAVGGEEDDTDASMWGSRARLLGGGGRGDYGGDDGADRSVPGGRS